VLDLELLAGKRKFTY